MQVHLDDRPFGELLGELLDQGRRLFRAELSLARAELKAEAKKAGRGAGMTVGGGLVLFIGALTFAAFLVLALAQALPAWASALVVSIVVLTVGAALTMAGIQRVKTVQAPKQTVQTLKEDSRWASNTMHAVKSQTHAHA